MHPWFQMVNPERNTLGEPAQDPESGRPMQVDELDAEIIRHMRWLFAPGPSHSDPEAKEVFDEEALLLEIQEKMTNADENMEKLFYHLLCQHKTELLENYKGDENEFLPGKHFTRPHEKIGRITIRSNIYFLIWDLQMAHAGEPIRSQTRLLEVFVRLHRISAAHLAHL